MKTKDILLLIISFIHSGLFAQQTLIVNLSNEIRPVTHCASGSLYGMTETLPVDIENLVAPLKPYMFCQPPRGGSENQHPYGSAIAVSERLVSTTGVVQITLADLLPYWPYQWPGKENWLSMVTSVINEKIASGRDNYHSYTIWNEPAITWNISNGDFYTECWKPTYDLIRSLDPTMKIVGSGQAYYSNTYSSEFLTFCKNNNCLPDMFSWHQCDVTSFVSNYEQYRQVELDLGISPREICINEYSSRVNDPYEGCPGFAVPFIAKFERHGIESACISWWHTQYPGRLGSLLTPSNEKGGGWYLYKWYGDMTGNMVQITPPNDYSDGIDGFGCIDHNQHYASICLGGNSTGVVNVAINNIPASFGSQVNVTLEYVVWENKDTPVSGTTTISTTQYNVIDNAIMVPVNVASNLYAYRVYIEPVQISIPPQITIISPVNNAAFVAPATIPIDVEVSDADGTIAHIDFYSNGADTTFHEEWLFPYGFNWTGVQAGTYNIKAIVYDNDGNTAEDSIVVKVNVPQAPYGGSAHAIPGTIQFENYDVGGNGFAYYDNTPGSETGITFRTDEDVDIEACTDIAGGYNVGWMTAGEWLEYTAVVAKSGLFNIVIRAACNGADRTVSLLSNETPLFQNIPIPNTGGWQVWTNVVINDVQLEAGEQVLRLVIGDTNYVNLNYMKFTAIAVEPVQLQKGWNIVGCPLPGTTNIEDALSSIWEHVEFVKNKDTFYYKNQSEFLNLLKSLDWGTGYLIKVSQDCELIWEE